MSNKRIKFHCSIYDRKTKIFYNSELEFYDICEITDYDGIVIVFCKKNNEFYKYDIYSKDIFKEFKKDYENNLISRL